MRALFLSAAAILAAGPLAIQQVPVAKPEGPLQSPQQIGSRTQSRNLATPPVKGVDRCAKADCPEALENRAAEVATPTAPQLTPEQRLSRSQADLYDPEAAAKELEQGRVGDSLAAQAAALRQLQPEPEPQAPPPPPIMPR